MAMPISDDFAEFLETEFLPEMEAIWGELLADNDFAPAASARKVVRFVEALLEQKRDNPDHTGSAP
jgi:hypothetical protein